jgi:hypothetical protein
LKQTFLVINNYGAIAYFRGTLKMIPNGIMEDLDEIKHLDKNGDKYKRNIYRLIVKNLINIVENEREDLVQELREEFNQEIVEYEKKYSSIIRQNKRYKKKIKIIDDFMKMFIITPLEKRLKRN